LMPSIIISRLKELLPGLAERLITLEATGEADLEFVCHPGKALSYLATELREANGGRVVPQVWQMVYNWLLAAPDYREQLAQVIAALTKGNQECPLTLNTSQKLYGARLKLSVSRVEQYKACPFAYFLAYGLRLREREQYKLGAPDLGEFFHAALKLFGERINRQGLDWGQISDAECIAVMAQIVEELAPQLQNEILLSTARYHYLVEKLKRTLDASVLALVEQARRGNFRPVGLEIGFGPGEALPPLVYNLKNGIEVELDGRIDRIDLAKSTDGHNYLRVIDYKSGQAELSLEDVYHGLKLQLLTYLDVALTHAHILTGNEAEAGGMLYFRLRDPVISTDGPLSAEDSAKSILNEFKQKGFVLADANLVKLMDNRLVNGKRSEIIPVSLKTQGGFYADSGVLTADNFALLRKYVQQQLAGTGEEILAGRLEMAPYQKRGRNACQYCRYKPVCRFDTMRLDNKYRLIRLEPKDKLWSRFFAANEGDIDG
ncbi:MAG TPA: PD-(D/E)XK nuclease family protein, partial [Desulfobacteria bacterium]|nr:PD-(D/E)XK nuclease family protein [Desulfobacteria bacterium]